MELTSKRGRKRKLEEVTVDSGHGTDDEGPTANPVLHYIRYDSTSTFPPTVMERGNSLEEIIKSVPSQGIFPSEMIETFEAENKHTNLTLRLRGATGKAGVSLVGRSMAATCNLKNCEARPDSVICDALLISQSLPPTLLTFIGGKKNAEAVVSSVAAASKGEGIDDYGEERKYNKSVAKAMMYARYFTDEPFDVIYGVIKSEDTKTTETFNRRLSNIKEETSQYSIGSNLLMSQERCLKIHKAFIMLSALSDIRLLPTVGKVAHYVMPVDMYRKLMLHLDSTHQKTAVSHSAESFHLLLNERLSKTGKRLVDTMQSETSIAEAEPLLVKHKGAYRKYKTWCSFVAESSAKHGSLSDILVFRNDGFSHIVVANSANKELKHIRLPLDHKEYVTGSITLPGKPCCLADIDRHDIMVTMPHKKLIWVVMVEPQLQKCETFNTEKKYFGITYLGQSRIASCTLSTIDILHFKLGDSLKLLKTIPDSSYMLLKAPKYVCSSLDGEIIVSDSCYNAITKISLAGENIFQHRGEVQCPRGVAVNSKGDIVFADVSLNKVTNIGKDGTNQENVLTDADGMRGPIGLCFDEFDWLYVAMKNNKVAVFETV